MRGRSNNEQEKKARLTLDFIAMDWSWIGFLTQNSRFGDKILYTQDGNRVEFVILSPSGSCSAEL